MRRLSRRRWVRSAGAWALALAGAAPVARAGPPRGEPAEPRGAPIAEWWRSFGDPQLDRLVEQSLHSNLELEVAQARLAEARTVVIQRRAPLLPTLSWDTNVQTAPLATLGFQFGGLGQIPNAPFLYWLASSAFNAALEVDLAGRNVANLRAAQRDVAALEADRERARLDVVAAVVAGYFDLVTARQQLALVQRQVELNEVQLELVELRVGRGQGSGLDLLQQQQALTQAKALIPQAELQVRTFELQLAVLLGRAPGEAIPSASRLPALDEFALAVDPDGLAEARPELRAARARVQAASERRKFAARGFVPRLRLQGSAGWQAIDIVEFRDQWFWNAGVLLSVPISTGGATYGALNQAKAAERTARAQVDALTLAARRELELALERERRQAEVIEAVLAQRQVAERSLDEAQRRYAGGLSDYLPVLASLLNVQQVELAQVNAERERIAARIAVFVALGDRPREGGPAAGPPRPSDPDPTPRPAPPP